MNNNSSNQNISDTQNQGQQQNQNSLPISNNEPYFQDRINELIEISGLSRDLCEYTLNALYGNVEEAANLLLTARERINNSNYVNNEQFLWQTQNSQFGTQVFNQNQFQHAQYQLPQFQQSQYQQNQMPQFQYQQHISQQYQTQQP